MSKFIFDKNFANEIGFDYNKYIDPIVSKLSEVSKTPFFKKQVKKENKKKYKNYTTFERYRDNEIEKYKKISKEKEFKQFMFAQQMLITNTNKNEQYNLNNDILQKAKDTYLYFFYTQKILEEKYTNNSNYVAIYLTLTTPSRFHRYSKTTQKANPNFDENATINEAYKLLNSSFREIYKDFKVNRKFEKVEYSKVIEPHENFTPHLHGIIYIKKEYIENMKNHINNIIKKNGLGEEKLEVVMNDTSRCFSYLLKYLQKSTRPSCEEDFHFLNGWKKANRIRVFTSSASILNREIYRKINSVTKLSKDLKDKNAIENVLENCYIKTKQINLKINEDFDFIKVGTKKTIKGNKVGRYKVIVKKERINKEIFLGDSFFNVLNLENKGFKKEQILKGSLENFEAFLFVFEQFENIKLDKKNLLEKYKIFQQELKNYKKTSLYEMVFENLTIKKVGYRIVDFKIYDKVKKELIYNKKDFELEKDLEIKNPKSWSYDYEKELYYENFYGETVKYSVSKKF
ncbi:replication endonuclease [Aliarcobacter butzleri]|uniref:replication endonuclease n=1 Tax=Aliarcobacter butzleri TaxID=28197 RepID=UPI003208C918